MPSMTRGPLPARVYWFRRVLVLGTAVLLVVAIARLLGDSSDGSDGSGAADAAVLAGDSVASSTSPSDSSEASSAASSGASTGSTPLPADRLSSSPAQTQTSQAPVLAAPTGPCAGSDIAVTPEIDEAVGGRDVAITLQLRSITAQACTWRVSPQTLTVNITSGRDAIWSSRDCPRAITRQDVVVRNATTTEVSLVWKQAKRSGEQCTVGTGWAKPGWYHVTAAALGGDPSDVQFELTTPTAATITVTASPKQSPAGKPSGKASGKPSGKPSGAVEPDLVD